MTTPFRFYSARLLDWLKRAPRDLRASAGLFLGLSVIVVILWMVGFSCERGAVRHRGKAFRSGSPAAAGAGSTAKPAGADDGGPQDGGPAGRADSTSFARAGPEDKAGLDASAGRRPEPGRASDSAAGQGVAPAKAEEGAPPSPEADGALGSAGGTVLPEALGTAGFAGGFAPPPGGADPGGRGAGGLPPRSGASGRGKNRALAGVGWRGSPAATVSSTETARRSAEEAAAAQKGYCRLEAAKLAALTGKAKAIRASLRDLVESDYVPKAVLVAHERNIKQVDLGKERMTAPRKKLSSLYETVYSNFDYFGGHRTETKDRVYWDHYWFLWTLYDDQVLLESAVDEATAASECLKTMKSSYEALPQPEDLAAIDECHDIASRAILHDYDFYLSAHSIKSRHDQRMQEEIPEMLETLRQPDVPASRMSYTQETLGRMTRQNKGVAELYGVCPCQAVFGQDKLVASAIDAGLRPLCPKLRKSLTEVRALDLPVRERIKLDADAGEALSMLVLVENYWNRPPDGGQDSKRRVGMSFPMGSQQQFVLLYHLSRVIRRLDLIEEAAGACGATGGR
ncbi:MAG: hypothetical protein HY927_12690 [Elusimicrobia bacterium]|nr:hypothetical protein [Elusimicrobiota bacterium]